MWNARLDEAQAGIKISRKDNNNLRYADDTTLMAESEEELKSLLMRVKEKGENVGLKLSIQKTKITASSPFTSWQTEGENVEAVTDLIFSGSQITVDGNCSHEIKRLLLLGRKPRTNLDSVLKSRDITLLTNLHCQSVDFSSSHVRMWKMDHKDGWAPKNWCFWIAVPQKTLGSPFGLQGDQTNQS